MAGIQKNLVRNQHFVPRLYLRNFATVGKKNRLYAYDKVTASSFHTNVENIANEAFFYDFPSVSSEKAESVSGTDVQAVETHLAKIEGDFAKVLRELLKEIADGAITPSTKREFIPFVALQLMRTREARDETVEIAQKVMQAMADIVAEDARNAGMEETAIHVRLKEEYKPLLHAQTMFDPKMMALICGALDRHIWTVGMNESEHPFYASDHPVARHAHFSDPIRSMAGIDSPGIEIVFPLSSRYLLSMVHRTSFPDAAVHENSIVRLTDDNVTFYNDLQVSNSHRQIYCLNSDFALAERICVERPYLRSPTRDRIEINPAG